MANPAGICFFWAGPWNGMGSLRSPKKSTFCVGEKYHRWIIYPIPSMDGVTYIWLIFYGKSR